MPGVALQLPRMAAGGEDSIGDPEPGAGKVASEAEAGKVALEAGAATRAEAAPEAGVVLEGRAGGAEEDDQAIALQANGAVSAGFTLPTCHTWATPVCQMLSLVRVILTLAVIRNDASLSLLKRIRTRLLLFCMYTRTAVHVE